MSNKANWTGAIAGVVAAGAAVAALFLPVENKETENIVETRHLEYSFKEDITVSPQKKGKTCDDKFSLLFKSAKSLSLSIYKDEEYQLIIDKALVENCFNEAYAAASHLSLSIYQDTAFKRIYLSAIDQKEFDIAKKAINKLSLKIYKDEGNQALLEALRNEI